MYYHTHVCDEVIFQYLPTSKDSKQLLADLNGMLINSSPVIDYPRLLPETYLNVGGLQIKEV